LCPQALSRLCWPIPQVLLHGPQSCRPQVALLWQGISTAGALLFRRQLSRVPFLQVTVRPAIPDPHELLQASHGCTSHSQPTTSSQVVTFGGLSVRLWQSSPPVAHETLRDLWPTPQTASHSPHWPRCHLHPLTSLHGLLDKGASPERAQSESSPFTQYTSLLERPAPHSLLQMLHSPAYQ